MFGLEVHTIGPNSQGYLTLGGGILADRLDLPDDPNDERWAHLLSEAAKHSPELKIAMETWKEIKFEFDTVDKLDIAHK